MEMDFQEDKKSGDMRKEQRKEEQMDKCRAIAAMWDKHEFCMNARGLLLLLTQSYLRKYIVLPSLIIAQNLG